MPISPKGKYAVNTDVDEFWSKVWRNFEKAFDHENLYKARFAQDPVLQNNIFVPLDAKQFQNYTDPATGKSVELDDVVATWYADESNGVEWQGRLTKQEGQFQTYDYVIAINRSLVPYFPDNSHVKIIFEGREVVARVVDRKGGEGIDMSKAVANELGITGRAKVKVVRVEPRGCAHYETTSGNPLAQCYPKDIRILFGNGKIDKGTKKAGHYSEEFSSKNFDRDDKALMDHAKKSWAVAAKVYLFQMTNGGADARPEESAEHTGDYTVRFNTTVGPFASTDAAEQWLNGYCNYCVDNACTTETMEQLNDECSGAVIWESSWLSPRSIRWHSNKKKPEPKIAFTPYDLSSPTPKKVATVEKEEKEPKKEKSVKAATPDADIPEKKSANKKEPAAAKKTPEYYDDIVDENAGATIEIPDDIEEAVAEPVEETETIETTEETIDELAPATDETETTNEIEESAEPENTEEEDYYADVVASASNKK